MIDLFEAAGVPLDVLIAAQAAGVISVDYYDQLHAELAPPSTRRYEAFKADLGSRGHLLPAMFAAFGIAEPDPTSHLSVEDEAVIEEWAALIDATGQTDLTLGIFRQFGESGRRSSVAALEAYAVVTEQMGPEFAGVPSQEVYERVFLPWAKAARSLPALAEWLTRHHMSRAIDDYSIRGTEQVLAESGYVPERPTVEPAVAFLDLTGFTSLTHERGDAIAAEMAMRLADLASRAVATHRGRVVKLLGDGVLMQFPDIVEAVEASLDLMDRLAASDLPPGHVGITEGPIVARDGDIFGRTVNLAARISDVAPSARCISRRRSHRGWLAGSRSFRPERRRCRASVPSIWHRSGAREDDQRADPDQTAARGGAVLYASGRGVRVAGDSTSTMSCARGRGSRAARPAQRQAR